MKNLIATFCFLLCAICVISAQVQTPEVITQDTTVMLKIGEQMTPTSSAALNNEMQRMQDNYQSLNEEKELIEKELALIERRRQLVQAQQKLLANYRTYSDLRTQVAAAEAQIAEPQKE